MLLSRARAFHCSNNQCQLRKVVAMWPLMRLCEGMAARKALLQKVVGHDGEEIDKEKEHFEEEEHFEEIDSEEEELLIEEVMAKRI